MLAIKALFKVREHTMAAVEAISTFFTVVASLALSLASQRANKARL